MLLLSYNFHSSCSLLKGQYRTVRYPIKPSLKGQYRMVRAGSLPLQRKEKKGIDL